jgi:hypothetical protein
MKVRARNLGLGRIKHKETGDEWVTIVGLFHNNVNTHDPSVLISVRIDGVVSAFLLPELEEIEYDQYS